MATGLTAAPGAGGDGIICCARDSLGRLNRVRDQVGHRFRSRNGVSDRVPKATYEISDSFSNTVREARSKATRVAIARCICVQDRVERTLNSGYRLSKVRKRFRVEGIRWERPSLRMRILVGTELGHSR